MNVEVKKSSGDFFVYFILFIMYCSNNDSTLDNPMLRSSFKTMSKEEEVDECNPQEHFYHTWLTYVSANSYIWVTFPLVVKIQLLTWIQGKFWQNITNGGVLYNRRF